MIYGGDSLMIQWEDSMTPQLRRIRAKALDLSEDVADGAEYVLEGAVAAVPKKSGDLAASGRVEQDRGGLNTVGITFDGPYARWIHEHVGFKHPQGGQAKFLEVPMLKRGWGAVKRAGEHFWGRL